MTLRESLSRNYKPIIYFILFVLIAFPLLHPIGLPLPIDKDCKDVYNKIESLNAGDVAVLTQNIGGGNRAELYPQYKAVLEHLLRKDGVKIILEEEGTEAPVFSQLVLQELNAFKRKTYGVDFVDLGYIPGDEAAIAGLSRDLHALVSKDYYGTPIDQIPMLKDVNTAKDFTIVMDITASADSQFWLNQAYAPYGTAIALGLASAKVPDATAYYKAGQIFGILESLKGAGQYEFLIGSPGSAIIGMDAQSLAHLYIAILIIFGNTVFFLGRKKK
jgi:hypothetical protein